MREFIGDSEHDLSCYLSLLQEYTAFFLELDSLLRNAIKSKNSVFDIIKEINEVISTRINTHQKTLEWEEIIKNYGKLSKIESNLDKKKSYLNLLKNMYQNG